MAAKQVHKEQPEVNIGLIGHVDHGKTTLTWRMSGKWTDTHSEEIKRGITIRLGYADSTFYKCPKCEGADQYTTTPECPHCKSKAVYLRKVSFVDAPGHESLMATMLSGANIMDGALLMVAANEECPQPQTREHLMALQIIGIKNVIVVQNKIDLVSKEDTLKNFKRIREFLKETPYKDAPIIPIAARLSLNLGYLIEAIQKYIPTPKRDDKQDSIMFVARSFDINKPGTAIVDIQGGVLGGSLKQGKLKVGDTIEIRPGRVVEEKNQKVHKPLTTLVRGLMTGGVSVQEIGPGGSVAVMTSLDPTIVKSDNLVGSVVGVPGKLPPVWDDLTLRTHLLDRVVGTKQELGVDPIKKGETLMLNVNASATVGIVDDLQKDAIHCKLKLPVCAAPESMVTISRLIGARFRLIGYGNIKS